MNRYLRSLILVSCAVIALGWCAIASAATVSGLYNTGVSNGVVLPNGTIPDPNYSLISVPGGTTDIGVRTSAGGDPIPPWLADDSASAWIGPTNRLPLLYSGIDGYGGTNVYRTTFSLDSAGAFTIAGQWAADNYGMDILVDGTPTGNATTGGGASDWDHWTSFTVTMEGTAGSHNLDFIVYNFPSEVGSDYASYTGLRVEFIPEPSTFALAGIGLAGLLAAHRRRKEVTMQNATK